MNHTIMFSIRGGRVLKLGINNNNNNNNVKSTFNVSNVINLEKNHLNCFL
jgi:hypothetical protein